MVINESAYYKGKLWCAYELKDHFGNYKEELRLKMRKESQERMFTCPDCGEPLILCAGPIMEPFFKHYEDTNCIINRKDTNVRNIVARRMLYHLARDSFPTTVIEVGKKLDKGVTADIWIQADGRTLVFEYLSYEMKLAVWEEKHNYFKEQGITDVWFLNYKRYQYETKTTFEYMISKDTKVLKFIDYETGEIILKEKCELSNGTTRLIAKSYPITEMRIDLSGEAICDYEAYQREQLALMEYEAKVEQLRRREEAAKRNRITKDFEESMDNEQQVLPFAFEQREDRVEKKITDRTKESLGYSIEDRTEKRTVDSIKKRTEESIDREEGNDWEETNDLEEIPAKEAVRRYPLDSGPVNSQTMKMPAIDELWELPKLVGKEWEVRAGNQKRYLYLKELNRELLKLQEEERENRVRVALNLLKTMIEAILWR